MQTSFVDLNQKIIVGAKKNTLTWFHEEGHIKYNESEEGMRRDFNKQSFFNSTIFFIVITLFINIGKYFAAFSYLCVTYYSFYEEIWCWRYAFKKMKKIKLKN
jgi:hypothetical protein